MTDVRSAFAAKLPTPPPDRDDEAVTRQAIIREAGLSVDDPETIANRHHPIPAGMDPVRLLKDYDTSRTTGRKVRCSACAHQQQHNRGFVAEMPDGRPALIGINCGERHFGDGEWTRMHVDLRREQDTVYYEARVLPALNQITAAYDRAVALKGAIKSYEAAWRGLKTSLPALFKLLETACKNDGFMDRYVTRQIPTIGRDGKATTKDQIDTVRFGKVPEPWAFGARSVVFDLDNAISTLRTSKLKFEGTADTKSRRAAFADLVRGRRMVEDVAKQVRAYASHSRLDWWSHAIRFCRAEGAMDKLTLLHRTFQFSNGWTNLHATIPECGLADVERADELIRNWPTAA